MAEVINMPKLGFDMQEGQLINWLKQPGDAVAEGDILAEIESDKATVEVEAFVEGTMLQHLVTAGDWVPIGAPIAVVGAAGETVDLAALGVSAPAQQAEAKAPALVAEAQTISVPSKESTSGNGHHMADSNGHADMPEGVRASPLARRIAAEKGIDLRAVGGSGPQGRVVKADIESYQGTGVFVEAPAPTRASAPTPVVTGKDDQTIETPRIRKRIGQRMVESKTTVPHFYVTATVDMGPAMELRKDLNKRLEAEGTKITVNDLIVKAVGLALRDFPNINSTFQGDTIIRHGHINVGIAVAIENGLLNVVAKDADQTPLTVMAQHNAAMINGAREGKVRPEDVEGETIAVSNLGAYDVDSFIAIINPPAAAIVAVGSAAQQPIVLEDGTLGVGWRMKATVSADHRVTDGAEAAKYLQRVKEILEDPLRLLM